MTHYPTVLTIDRLRLSVRLGAEAGEREKPQPVEVEVRLYFPQHPPGAEADESTDFICYDAICNAMMERVKGQEFRLIEYLTMALHETVRTELERELDKPQAVRVWIRLCKCNPPVPYLLGGAAMTYSDLPADATIVGAR